MVATVMIVGRRGGSVRSIISEHFADELGRGASLWLQQTLQGCVVGANPSAGEWNELPFDDLVAEVEAWMARTALRSFKLKTLDRRVEIEPA